MSFDKRIKNPKRDILCYLDVVSTTDTYKESLIGKRGFFANSLQEFAYLRECHFKKLARIDLDVDSEDYTEKFINEECFTCSNGKYWKFFLPEECVEPYRLDKESILKACYTSKNQIADCLHRQNLLLQEICDHRYGYENPGDKSMVWHMRDILKKAYDDFRALLNEFEKGNY
jgi:hypothetical protein